MNFTFQAMSVTSVGGGGGEPVVSLKFCPYTSTLPFSSCFKKHAARRLPLCGQIDTIVEYKN